MLSKIDIDSTRNCNVDSIESYDDLQTEGGSL